MAKSRMINTRFWDDNYTSNLDPIEKLMFLYFLTNTSTNISGIYEIPLKKIANETGIDKEMVIKIIERFQRDQKLFYVDGWVGIKNFIKNQNQRSITVQKGIKNEINLIPQQILTKMIGYGYPIDTPSYLIKSNLIKDDDLRKSSSLENNSLSVSKTIQPPVYEESKMEHDEFFESLGLHKESLPNSSGCYEEKWFNGNSLQSDGKLKVYEKKWTEYSGKVSPSKIEIENQNTLVLRIQHKFASLCEKELGTKPIIDIKGYKIIQFALNSGGLTETKIYDLFDEWFGLGKPNEDTIQITRALSSNNINSYKTRNI